MIGWGIRMILKLWAKRQLTVIILRILKLKLEKFLSGKLRALIIFNGHYQWILWLDKITINLLDKRIVQNMKKCTNRKWTQTLNLHNLICRRHRHWTQEQRKRKAQRRKSVVSIEKMTCQTHLWAMTLILPMTVITDASNAKIRSTGKRIGKLLTTSYKSMIIRF